MLYNYVAYVFLSRYYHCIIMLHMFFLSRYHHCIIMLHMFFLSRYYHCIIMLHMFFFYLGIIIDCLLYKLTLSDQAQVLQLRVRLSDLV